METIRFNGKNLKQVLEHHYAVFHHPAYLEIDPLTVVHRFRSAGQSDLEIAALVSACLAYGRVENIIGMLDALFGRITGRLADFTVNTNLKEKKSVFKGMRYRFNTGSDVALLFEAIKNANADSGSLGRLFADKLNKGDTNVRDALESFVSRLKAYAGRASGADSPGFAFLLPSPRSGSACKRMCMFLRWMVRPDDGIDLGLWSAMVPSSMLVIPVDTHVAKGARQLRMTTRGTADWIMAEEITSALRTVDPQDPVRFDFSLCRAGMVLARERGRHAA